MDSISSDLESHPSKAKLFFKRYWYYIVIVLVILAVLIVVLVVVIRKQEKKDEEDDDGGNPGGPVAITEMEELVVDLPVGRHPILVEIFELFRADVNATPPPPNAAKAMGRQIVQRMCQMSKRKPTEEELKEMEGVEKHLHDHHVRPWGWEGQVDQHWTYRFGKFVRNEKTCPALQKITSLVSSLCSAKGEEEGNNSVGGYFYYPQGGCREWHTNKDDWIGWRGYFIYCPKGEDQSSLNVIDPGTNEMHRFGDRSGILRLFRVTRNPVLWHAVTSDTDRYSLGFRLSNECVEALVRVSKE